MNRGGQGAGPQVAVMQVGLCRVEMGPREITGPSSPRLRRVTPKAMAVLRLLADSPGQVVSREALLAGAWPDSAPTDDVLTQAITLLRKTFAALDTSQPYIETIARSGYRLLVDVAVLDEPAAVADGALPPGAEDAREAGVAGAPQDVVAGAMPQAAPPTGAGYVPGAAPAVAPVSVPASAGAAPGLERQQRREFRRRRRRWLFLVLAGLLLACLSVLAVVLWRDAHRPGVVKEQGAVIDRPYRLLTATLERESEPALSPDGGQIAYVHPLAAGGSEVLVQTLAPNSRPHRLDTPPAGAHDRQPVWSPDGRLVAFSRTLPDGRCAVLLVRPGSGDPPSSLMRCDRTEQLSFDFSADGKSLLFGSSADVPGNGAIARLDITSRQWTVLDYPRQPGDLDYSPRQSPDGQWLVFARNPHLGQLWRMPAGGGELQPVGDGRPEQVRGFSWLPDSRHLLLTHWVGLETRLFLVDALHADGGAGMDLGVDQAMQPVVARDVPVMGFVHRLLESRLLQVGTEGRLRPLLAGSGQDLLPSLSPDASQLVFVSDRSGVPGLWLGPADGQAAPIQVPGLLPATFQPSAWSPDGQRIATVGLDGDGRRVLLEIEPQTLGVVGLPLPGSEPLQVAYTDSPGQLLVIQLEAGRPVLRLYDRTRSPWQVLAERPGVSQVRWDAAGRGVVFARIDSPGLFRLSAALSGRAQALPGQWPERQRYRSWSVGGDGRVWATGQSPGCPLVMHSFAAVDATGAGLSSQCLSTREGSLTSGFSGALNAGLVIATGHNEGGDIAIMALPGTAPGQLPDGLKSLMGR